jgi:hypothetical protein
MLWSPVFPALYKRIKSVSLAKITVNAPPVSSKQAVHFRKKPPSCCTRNQSRPRLCGGTSNQGVVKMNYTDHILFLHKSFLSPEKCQRAFDYLNSFSGILKRIRFLPCTIEIIGNWIFCFNAKALGAYLHRLGFWYSVKHCAWVYSGTEKENTADDETLDDIKSRLGYRSV